MVNAAYDHIVAVVIIGAIFVGTVVALPALTYKNLQTVDQQQLRNTALNVFNSMLLGVGSPSDWGSIPSDQFNQDTSIKLFGLASPTSLSKFVLDSGKVQRLNLTLGPGIEYNRVRELLNIQDYGFKLTILRPFSVDSYLTATKSLVSFSVNVTRAEDGTPIPNAEIGVTIMVTASSLEKNQAGEYDLTYKVTNSGPYLTDLAGNCRKDIDVDLVGYAINYAVAILQIKVGGMTTIVVDQNENEVTKYIKINTFGDNVDLTFRNESVDSPSERRIVAISAFDFENIYNLFQSSGGNSPNYKVTNGEGYVTWSTVCQGLEVLDPPVMLMVLQLTVPQAHDGLPARRLVLAAGPYSMSEPDEIFNLGPDPRSENVIATLRRIVEISGNTYVAQISFWRE